ncbi:hypothetical protein BCA37_20840 [Mycobacterium sp. djl-10]|nr:hypothetical protein BCA37_20840 [Mycobacterium sp. djl-10]
MTSTVDRIPAVRAGTPAVPQPVSGRWRRLPWAVLAASLLAFGLGAPSITTAAGSYFGLLATASPLYGASILLAAFGFAVAMRQRNTAAGVSAIVVVIICQRLPRALFTEAPMYAWTYKHLGVVDYIQQNHALARGVDIYNGWPGLFATTAWFSDLTGVPAIDIAHWFTPVAHVALAGLAYAAARAWRLSPDQALTATFLVVSLNWVEQDYFAPQALAMILVLGVIMLLGLALDRPADVTPLLILFAAITITHQLTPAWVLLAVVLLVIGRKTTPWWITLPMALMFLGVFLANHDITQHYTLFSSDVVSNAKTQFPPVATGVVGQLFTSAVMRMLSMLLWLSAAIVLVWRWGRREPVWALGVLALSPVLILGGQGYGGEAVFRVFLYSLPGCAFVLAPPLLSALRGRRTRWVATCVTVVVLTAMSAQAYFGSWFTNLISRSQIHAADAVLAGGDYPAYVTPLVPVWPERGTAGYVKYAQYSPKYDHSLMFQEGLIGVDFDTEAEYQRFLTVMGWRTDASTYLVLSEPMSMYAGYFGLFPPDALANLREHVEKDPRWQPVETGTDVWVYLHRVTKE